MHHTQLKIRRDIASNFIMIDSPGMIDAPVNYAGMLQGNRGGGSHAYTDSSSIMDRGYDFTGVVRWLAGRADIVCLFFDPDKPGTTGETLSVLLHALSGMDHKLLIVLNKADQFQRIHDFARAYGSLCWNLSKVIPRKDLPRIFTMCLPVQKQDGNEVTAAASNLQLGGLQDLQSARDEGTCVMDGHFECCCRVILTFVNIMPPLSHKPCLFIQLWKKSARRHNEGSTTC